MTDLFPGFADHLLQTRGAPVHARVAGRGPPVLLLHGFPQTHYCWRHVIPALAEANTVVAPDLPGHGSAAARRPATFAGCAAYVRALARDEPFVLAGYSHGGGPAHSLARLLEEQGLSPGGLVMIDTYAPEPEDELSRVFGAVMGAVLDEGHELIQESVDDDNLVAMGTYVRLSRQWEPRPVEAPSLLVRASEQLGDAFEGGRLPWWQVPRDVAVVTGHHFGLIDEAAGETARVIDAWIRETTGESELAAASRAGGAR
jgi:pimeloyl-ACP methyl ester carboxylesterase